VHEQIITIYCLCEDFLKAWGYNDDKQATLSSAEVMTCALVAAYFFGGCHQTSRYFLAEHRYFSKMLSKSRFNRRLHALPECLWQALFSLVGAVHQQCNATNEYIVDSCPIPVCDNIRIRRSHLYEDESFRGYVASKRRYFFGLRLFLVVTVTGEPVEMLLLPGSSADITGLKSLALDLPEGSTLYADAGNTDYAWEDGLLEEAGIRLVALRRGNSKRPHPGPVGYLCQYFRKRVETTFSLVTERLPKSLHAVTPRGFELKVFLTVLAFSIVR
jgi:Transposase DDE domain